MPTVYSVEPVTSPKRLRAFVSANAGLRGIVVARRALKYVQSNSYSPMETVLVMLLCLPPLIGGYGLSWPKLNSRIAISSGGGAKRYRFCDLYWPEARIAIEYDSSEFHMAGTKWVRDASRRVELGLSDIEIISASKEQVENAYEMEKLARLIAKRLPRRIPARNFEFSAARQQLRRELMPWL